MARDVVSDGEKLRRIVVRLGAGPAWSDGSVREQPGWDEHAAYVDALVARGTMVMGGPFSDHSGSLLLLEGVDIAEARRIVEGDPWIHNGVWLLEDVREWSVVVDALAGR